MVVVVEEELDQKHTEATVQIAGKIFYLTVLQSAVPMWSSSSL